MKRIKDKFKRIVKYWNITYQQASNHERMIVGMFALMMIVYVWWTMLVF